MDESEAYSEPRMTKMNHLVHSRFEFAQLVEGVGAGDLVRETEHLDG